MLREQEKLQLLKQFRQSVDPEAPWAGFYTLSASLHASVHAHKLLVRRYHPAQDAFDP